jgi:N-acetylglucosamine malate deacetylase 1
MLFKTKNKKIVLVVAAHPDDEILGCGGTMARHADEGDIVYTHILAEGLTSRDLTRLPIKWTSGLEKLENASKLANKTIGVHSLKMEGFPDNSMDTVEFLKIVKAVEQHIHKVRPDIVYTHFGGDLNIDHQLTSKAVMTACRPVPGFSVRTLLFFEVLSSTNWQINLSDISFFPNYYVDITKYENKKNMALNAYRTEMRKWPHSRSIKAIECLAGYRGSSCGVKAAEAFMIGRAIA